MQSIVGFASSHHRQVTKSAQCSSQTDHWYQEIRPRSNRVAQWSAALARHGRQDQVPRGRLYVQFVARRGTGISCGYVQVHHKQWLQPEKGQRWHASHPTHPSENFRRPCFCRGWSSSLELFPFVVMLPGFVCVRLQEISEDVLLLVILTLHFSALETICESALYKSILLLLYYYR